MLTQYNILSKISKNESAREKLSHKTTIIGHCQTPVNIKVHSSNRKEIILDDMSYVENTNAKCITFEKIIDTLIEIKFKDTKNVHRFGK